MTTDRPLRVGYLHVGRARSGLRRYGAILAAEAARRSDLEVLQSDAGGREAGWSALRAAASRLQGADVAHVQWKLADWEPRLGGMPRLEIVLRSLRRPMVVTLHDVFVPNGRWSRRLSPQALGLRRLAHAASCVVVHSEDERARLDGFVPDGKIQVVPHFVEVRAELPERSAARQALGIDGRRVVTLLGYLTKRRGHRLVIDALAGLPDDITALFVGSVIEGRDHVRSDLEAHAAAVGVAERVRFMGYVSEAGLEQVLVATDVALCPFRAMSASGALATWISAGRTIVASDLPPVRELEALAPGAILRFAPYEPEALAEAIGHALAVTTPGPSPAVAALARQLATPRIMERYVGLYRAAAGRDAGAAGMDARADATKIAGVPADP